MYIAKIFEITAIITVSCLLVLFAGLYFMKRKQKKLTAKRSAVKHIYKFKLSERRKHEK